MRLEIGSRQTLERLFGGMVEQVFMSDMGICDTTLTDYLSRMLVEFVHVDQIFRMRRVDGETITELSRVEAEAFLGPGVAGPARTRLINKYIGDFTLFWTGVYPESLRRPRTSGDRLHEYMLFGKRSYGIAGELTGVGGQPPAELLRHLSTEFEFCVHGLHRVRAAWERRFGGGAPEAFFGD
jgi:hypothetical protein